MKSIIQNEKESYLSRSTHNLEEHHIFFGTANRKLSEKYGLKIWLTAEEHRGTIGVHNNKKLDNELKEMAQQAFQDYYGKKEIDFIKIFGKNYL